VTRTRGQVLLRDGGGLVDARYSASCGGHGSNNDDIWGGSPDPSLRGRVDARPNSPLVRSFSTITDKNIGEFLSRPASGFSCGSTRYGKGRVRWTATLQASELRALIDAQYKGVGAVRGLVPLERDPSGRVSKLQIVGSARTIVATGDLHIRRLLGGLKSTLFSVSPVGPKGAPTAFEVRGAGFGHGVGMCQTGAIGMAEHGKTHSEILHHYYPGSHTQPLY
jgi:SpoIID/LytB domain protein